MDAKATTGTAGTAGGVRSGSLQAWAVAIRPRSLPVAISPVIAGGGKRFFPDGVRLDLELLDERRFGSGVLYLRYGVRGA